MLCRASVTLLVLLVVAAGPASGQPAAPANLAVTHTFAWELVPGCSCTYAPQTENAITFPDPTRPGVHTVTVVAIDDQQRRGAPSTIGFLETLQPAPSQPCDYQAPAAGSVMEKRPIGQRIQGFNPIGPSGTTGNQAARLTQLEAWGWVADMHDFADGSVRPDKIDRLFLIVRCVGL